VRNRDPWLATLACVAALGCTRANPSFVSVGQSMDAPGSEAGADTALQDLAGGETPADVDPGPDLGPGAEPAADAGIEPDLSAEAPGVVEDMGLDAGADAGTDQVIDAGGPIPDGSPPDSSLTVGLVARYRLDPSSGNAVPDDSGNRSGTRSGSATWTSPGFLTTQFTNGGALSLDGATGYVTLPAPGVPAVGGEKSLSLWFWQPAAMNSFRRVLLSAASPGASVGIHLGLQRGVPAVWAWSQAADQSLVTHSASSPGGWTHLAYTHRTGAHILYVGGVRVASSTVNYGGNTAPTQLMLGAWSATDASERWTGLIDELRIYDRVLTAAEVSALAAGAQ
jgi:hypothetical protein